jgi:hypothetical protein
VQGVSTQLFYAGVTLCLRVRRGSWERISATREEFGERCVQWLEPRPLAGNLADMVGVRLRLMCVGLVPRVLCTRRLSPLAQAVSPKVRDVERADRVRRLVTTPSSRGRRTEKSAHLFGIAG